MKYVTPAVMLAAIASVSVQARAETPKPATAPLRAPQVVLISVFDDAGQALLKDRIRGEYVVVRVGERLGEYQVARISHHQIVLSSTALPTQHYVLPRMPPPRIAGVAVPNAPVPSRQTPLRVTSVTAPINPYPAATPPAPAKVAGPKNPYGSASAPAVTAVVAPPGQRAAEKPIAVPTTPATPPAAKLAAGPEKPTTATLAEKPPAADAATPPAADSKKQSKASRLATTVFADTSRPASRPPIKRASPVSVARVEGHKVRRTELEAAVADFGALSREVQLARSGKHLQISGLARGSFLHRVGLKKGDILHSVAGQNVRTIDDGAAVYTTIMTAKAFDVIVKRHGKQITLRYRITD